MRFRLWRILLTALLAYAALPILEVYGRFEKYWAGQDYATLAWVGLLSVVALGAGILALALLWKAPDRADARSLGVSLAAAVFAYVSMFAGLRRAPGLEALTEAAPWTTDPLDAAGIAALGVAAAAFTRFCTVFPRPLTVQDVVAYAALPRAQDSLAWLDDVSRRTRNAMAERLARLPLVGRWSRLRLAPRSGMLTPKERSDAQKMLAWVRSPRYATHVAAPFVVIVALAAAVPLAWADGPARELARIAVFGLAALFMLGAVGCAIFALHFLRASYSLAGPAEQRRMLWMVEGVLTVVWAPLLFLILRIGFGIAGVQAPEILLAVAFPLLALVVLGCLAAAIFGSGAIDSTLVIRKTTLYSLFGAVLFFVFAAVESIVADTFAARIGVSEQIGAWFAAGVLALVSKPLHDRLRAGTNQALDRVLPPSILAAGPREETAVLFCDIVGFTRLGAENESDAITLASVLHRSAQRVANAKRGRLVKTLGDGVLLEFASASAAIEAAADLRESFTTASELLALPRLQTRTGVHVGPVVRAPDGDILGDAVNVAARLQASAEPGEILASGAAAARVEEPNRFSFDALGSRILKNLPEPVECVRVTFRAAVVGA